MQVRRERNEMLRFLSEKKRRAFYEQFIGTTRDVLFENHKNPTLLTGFTDNYIKIELKKDADTEGAKNFVMPVDLMAFTDEGDVKAQLSVEAFVWL